ncbi:MAG: RHS repeat-associated core domain-containing protein [Chthoniobacterales bacterium]
MPSKVLEQYRYDAFGQPEFHGPPIAGNPGGALLTGGTLVNNRFLFTGREWVARYGFYEYRNRAYNPTLGRFMSEDPKGFAAGDRNLFRYCGGDPVNRTDPTGLDSTPIDSETESWSLRASAQDAAARRSEGLSLNRIFVNRFAHSEFGTTVHKENGKAGMSQSYTDRDPVRLIMRNYPGKTSLVYDHTHDNNAKSRYTGSHLSVGDVGVANKSGVAVQVTTPNGDIDRMRPSAASTEDGRWREGGTIERLSADTGHFETLKGAKTNVPREGPVFGESMGAVSHQEQSAPSAKDVDAATQATGVPSLGAEAVNFAPGRP